VRLQQTLNTPDAHNNRLRCWSFIHEGVAPCGTAPAICTTGELEMIAGVYLDVHR
jgi:hypothetical protein